MIIQSLQALRFVFIMLVVMSHIIGKAFDFGGECGVMFFFMLSGFILAYAYGKQVSDDTFQHKRFLGKQLSKFYPLHVLTFAVMALLDARLGIFYGWGKLVANLLLLQSWVPDNDFYFVANGSSWFLSDLLFFYVLFPFLYRYLMRLSGQCLLVLVFIVLAAYAAIAYEIPTEMINPILYAAPWMRVLDFSIGLLVYRLYVSETGHKLKDVLTRRPSMVELLMVALVVISFFVYGHVSWRFRCAALFWLVLPPVLYTFVSLDRERGFITAMFHHRWMQWLGSISLEIYLVHFVLMRFFYSVLTSLGCEEACRLHPLMVAATLVVIVLGSYFTKRFFVVPVCSCLLKRIR